LKIVRMQQGSPEWHEHRSRYRNASETPAVLGRSPWQTPYQLWQLKLGLTEQKLTASMRHGSELEPVARAAYERQTGRVMQPLVVVDGEYSASLDGITLTGDRLLEIKAPMKGRDSTLWKTVEAGQLPEHYQWQV
jgi:putative phage-type endonuclease